MCAKSVHPHLIQLTDQLTAQPLSLPECPQHMATDLMIQWQNQSLTCDLGCCGSSQSYPSRSYCPTEHWSLPVGVSRWSTLEPPAQGLQWTLAHWENANVQAAGRGDTKIPTPACRLSSRATPDWDRVQPLSRRLLPEGCTKLCI